MKIQYDLGYTLCIVLCETALKALISVPIHEK